MEAVKLEDVKVIISENKFESGRTTYSVKSSLGCHTFVNQAETEQEAENIADIHRQHLVQIYTPVMADSSSKKDKKKQVEVEEFVQEQVEEQEVELLDDSEELSIIDED